MGSHNFEADREMACRMIATAGDAAKVARANRAFPRRAMGELERAGVRQYLDVGAGLLCEPDLLLRMAEATGLLDFGESRWRCCRS